VRAGLPEITTGKSQGELREIVRQERKVEFPFEGLRFFDLRRWKIAEDVMPGKLYGRPLRDYETGFIPTFDENGTPHYEAYGDELRQFDTRNFNPARDYLWPIPQKELDINSNLTQNPGY
jgi:starch-binding outer membrane protein, SusD/RagB family